MNRPNIVPKIGIAGIGGIGSNVAVNLVRSGYNRLKIIDMDRVEQSNVNRQFYFADQIGIKKVTALHENLLRINKNLCLEKVDIKIERGNCAGLFAECDIVIEGLDDKKSKKMLLEQLHVKPLVVSASGIAGSSLSEIRIRSMGNCIIVGDFISDCSDKPVFVHKLQAVCAKMTEVIMNFI